MNQLYHTLDAFLAPGILVGFAVCFVFLHIPQKAALRNYRLARYVMGAAYVFYALCIGLEYHAFDARASVTLAGPIILFVACIQAFLFTYTLITLIRLNYVTARKVMIEVACIAAVAAAVFAFYLTHGHAASLRWVFMAFVFFYVAQLARYVLMFRRAQRRFEEQMDNYYSDTHSRRLQWVGRSFAMSLAVGVLALVYALVPVTPVGLAFIIIVIVFYTSFGVRFINYALQFQLIETAITIEGDTQDGDALQSHQQVQQRIDELMEQEKLFRRSDLSVNDIAKMLNERPRTVSAAINACRKVNFKTYINEFRVLEAKRLLDEDKGHERTIDAIAGEAGFSNRSSFYRVFKRSQGISPSDYRLAH